jgi:chromosome partitioning protein
MDPQGNATTGLGVDKRALSRSVYDCLTESLPLSEVAVQTGVPNLWVAPATVDLAGAEVELVGELARETRLRLCLAGVAAQYSYVILDTPPSLGLLTVNSLTAAQCVLIPLQCEYYALEGLNQLRRSLDLVRRVLNPALEILGIALTMYDGRTRLSAEVADEVRRHFGGLVFRSVIPRSVRLSEAPIYGKPVLRYAPESRGAQAYRELAQEVLERTAGTAQQNVTKSEVIESGEAQGDQIVDTGGDAGRGGWGAGDGGGAGEPGAEPAAAAGEGRGDSAGGAGGLDQGARDPAASGGEAAGGQVRADRGGEEAGGGAAGGAEEGAGGGAGSD